ncbi:MAG TPA: MerR family transcriptional regulator [Drouetiella sp.]
MIVEDAYTLTIDELSEEVVRVLKANNLFASHNDNRVSAAPDMRTIRYYTSLGLLDRPSIEGRVAKYSRKHLLQLLAVKTLQGVSLPLSEIQEQLYGLTEAELEAVIAFYIPELSERTNDAYKESIRTVTWREIIIEPGLKIMADDTWGADADLTAIEQKIRAALEVLKHSAQAANGDVQ